MPSWGRGVGGGWRGPWVSGGLIGTPRCHVTQIPRHATVLKVVGERQQVAVMHLLSLSARLLHLPIRWGGRERKVKGLSERWKCIYKIKKRFREKGITRVGGVNREQVDETRLMGWKRKKTRHLTMPERIREGKIITTVITKQLTITCAHNIWCRDLRSYHWGWNTPQYKLISVNAILKIPQVTKMKRKE